MGQSALLAGMDTARNAFSKTAHSPDVGCIGGLAFFFTLQLSKLLGMSLKIPSICTCLVLQEMRYSFDQLVSSTFLLVISFTPEYFATSFS